jgi:putative transcriptional regulator
MGKMSVYESVIKGLNEAVEYEKGDLKGAKKRVIKIAPLPHYTGKEVKDIRLKLELTQSTFADLMGVSIKTVEAWEAGKNTPQGPAQRMLEIIVTDSRLVEEFVFAK